MSSLLLQGLVSYELVTQGLGDPVAYVNVLDSYKDIFEADLFRASTFEAGIFRGKKTLNAAPSILIWTPVESSTGLVWTLNRRNAEWVIPENPVYWEAKP